MVIPCGQWRLPIGLELLICLCGMRLGNIFRLVISVVLPKGKVIRSNISVYHTSSNSRLGTVCKIWTDFVVCIVIFLFLILETLSKHASAMFKMSVFYAPQLYRQVLLRRVLAMGILSVCPSVCLSVTTRWYTKPRWDRDSGSSPYDSLESVVSNEVIWCQWVRRFPLNEGIKEGYPP